MNENLKNLYTQLGYKGALPATIPTPSEAAIESVSAAALVNPSVAESETTESSPADVVVTRVDPAEVPPLSREGIDQLEMELNENPGATVARARQVLDEEITESELRYRINQARLALTSPATAVDFLAAESFHLEAASQLPPGFEFDGMDLENIPINPGDTKFETEGDALGWVINAGPFVLFKPSKAKFRWHNHPDFAQTKFIYSMAEPTEAVPLEVALISDFGNGRYHARYIAKQLQSRSYPVAIHLGDVYYAGRRSEFEEFFAAPLDPLLPHTQLFALNSNHEMYSGGKPYFEFMDKRRNSHQLQQQEGSYFCLRSSKFQIIGIDTAYFGHGRYKEPALLEWLAKTLQEGRQSGSINILMSADHPYEYGDKDQTKLLRKDLDELVLRDDLVDLWFWGNTHYGALFDRSSQTPFVGSCIGHAGYPYDRQKPGKPTPASLKFLETSARFPEWTNLRQDRGNNGYCVMELKSDGSITLKYIDWMSHLRCEATLSRSQATGKITVASVKLGE